MPVSGGLQDVVPLGVQSRHVGDLDVEARPSDRRSFEGSSDIGNRMNGAGGLQDTSDTIQQVRNATTSSLVTQKPGC
jgi:hypothetical protein